MMKKHLHLWEIPLLTHLNSSFRLPLTDPEFIKGENANVSFI